MRGIVAFLLLISFSALKAQTFNIRFVFDGVGTTSGSVEATDSFIFVSGTVADTTITYGLKSFLAKFDFNGNLISTEFVRPAGQRQFACSFDNSMIKTLDGGFAVTGYSIDTLGKMRAALAKYNSQGLFEWYGLYNIYPNIYCRGYRLLQMADSSFYVTGDIQFVNQKGNYFLLKTDQFGNEVFSRAYTGISDRNTARGICLLPNQELLISIGTNDVPLQIWNGTYRTCLMRVDLLGNQSNLRCTLGSDTIAEYNVRINENGNYLTSCVLYDQRTPGTGDGQQGILIEWDTSFNQVSQTGDVPIGEVSTFYDFEQNEVNDTFLCGEVRCNFCTNPHIFGSISKIANGQVVWTRTHLGYNGLPTDWSILEDIELLPDGSIIACGEAEGTAFPGDVDQQAWLIRLNPDGCLDDGFCGYTGVKNIPPTTPENAIAISPNPSNGIFTIKSQTEIPPYTGIEVYDLQGNILTTQPLNARSNLLNLYHLPTGTYVYRITNSNYLLQTGKVVIVK